MSVIQRTNSDRVRAIVETDFVPRKGQTVSGYGGAIPTKWLIQYRGLRNNRAYWYRVKAMSYGNSASLYIRVKGVDLFLDIETEQGLSATIPETRG